MGGGDFYGANDVVDVDTEALDDYPMTMYLGYHDV
jgi:hypothetical protein